MGRKLTHVIKVSMLLSLAESDSLVVTGEHFKQAKKLLDEVTADNSFVISSAMMADSDSQQGINQTALRAIGKVGDAATITRIKQRMMSQGIDPVRIESTLNSLVEAGAIGRSIDGGSTKLKLLVEPNTYL